jgi:uncharacterized membrane protein
MSDQETPQTASSAFPDEPQGLAEPRPRQRPHRATTLEDIDEGRAAAILAYVPFGCFVALVRFRDNPFAMRHGKQGLLLSFFELLAGLFLIPRLSEYFWVTIVFACLASAVTGIYNALQGKEWIVPIIGKWFEEHLDEDRLPTATDDGRIEL